MIFRLMLLLALAGGLILFAQFNWTPIALTFLGLPLPVLPLSLWMLAAIGMGILTSLLLHALFTLTYHVGGRRVRSRLRQAARRTEAEVAANAAARQSGQEDDAAWKNWDEYDGTPRSRQSTGKSTTQAPIDDWEAKSRDDWEDYELGDRPRDRQPWTPPERPTAAARPAPEPEIRFPGTASDRAGASKPKPVVDADYRVIVPPHRSVEPTPTQENADDWFEDDLETDEERRRRSGL
jgi:hypothetical protein